jgi:hypothetical protein
MAIAQLSTSSRVALVLLMAATIAVWLNGLQGAFQFDDYNVIVDKASAHSFGGWLHAMPGIRPLLKLSYALNWSISPDPFGFHLVNLAAHLGSTALVFFLCRRFVQVTGVTAEGSAIAFTAAALFALHPAQTEVVTYVSGRSVGLMSLFYLGALMAHVKGGDDVAWRGWEWLSLLLFVAAMAVKETAVTLPLAIVLWEQARGREPLRQSLRRVLPHFVLLAALALAVLLHARYRHLLLVSLGTRSPLDNLLVQVHGVFYLMAGPLLTLRTQSDPVVATGWPWFVTFAKGALLFALMGTGFHQLKRRPWLGFGLLWFFLHLLPTNSFIARLDVANDRQLYLPLIGVALMVAVVVHRRLPGRAAATVTLLLALALAGATALRNRDYRDEITFWVAATHAAPEKARAWNNFGYAFQMAGRHAEAREAYLRALALDPAYWRARVNLMVVEEGVPGAGREDDAR